QHSDPQHVGTSCGEASHDGGFQHLAACTRIPSDDRDGTMGGIVPDQHPGSGAGDAEGQLRSEIFVRETTNAVGAEIAAHARTRSALRVLGRLTGLLEAVLLTLLHPRIASEEACLLEGWAILRLQIDEGPRDGQAERAGLARDATAPEARDHVVLPIP